MRKPPKILRAKGRAFWRKVLQGYALEENHELQLLLEACGCLDRIEEAQAEIQEKGAYLDDRFGQRKAHPALNVERDQRILFCRLLRELGLEIESEAYTRPRRPAYSGG